MKSANSKKTNYKKKKKQRRNQKWFHKKQPIQWNIDYVLSSEYEIVYLTYFTILHIVSIGSTR
ncbi:unnamed protein product [Schistosoma mansoni]|uniref:Smp_205500 n=1 Tax=Schistosoma mansoni TaxID=6183 RepID=UPI00022C84B2|nr:unnamed protein product [Schistosoma mansoni]|eukprot:XP_018644733.1 unnamed protein product [Schistosoma mansoni]